MKGSSDGLWSLHAPAISLSCSFRCRCRRTMPTIIAAIIPAPTRPTAPNVPPTAPLLSQKGSLVSAAAPAIVGASPAGLERVDVTNVVRSPRTKVVAGSVGCTRSSEAVIRVTVLRDDGTGAEELGTVLLADGEEMGTRMLETSVDVALIVDT